MTDAETILWSRLRDAPDQRFRRQHPIGPYIADFACVPQRLVIEIDGATHGTESAFARDVQRDAYMQERGWRVMRVSNQDVYEQLDGVMYAIFERLKLP